MTGIQWLEFGSARTENVNRAMKERSMRKHLETEGISLCKESEQLLRSSVPLGYSEVLT